MLRLSIPAQDKRGRHQLMKYSVIASGSKGNAVVIEDVILIDCGVSYKSIRPYVPSLKLVLLTHEHGDHFRESTIRRLANERPTLRFGCGAWLVKWLLACGVSRYVIDVYDMDTYYQYSRFGIEAFCLYHNAPNCGYKIFMAGRKALYATDTCKIETEANDYDLYMIEANYDDDELKERINRKEAEGATYINELVVPENHLSRAAATEWLMKNMGPDSEYIFMHVHEEQTYEGQTD